jgi:ABC-type lipoprotein release transport system permease subunit
MHLGDAVLIKDNHIAALRAMGMNLKDIVAKARQNAPAGMTIDASTGHIKWKAANKDVGTHTFKARVTDNHGLSDEQTITVTVAKRSTVVLGSNLMLLVLVLIIILAVLIAVVAARLRQNKKEPEEEPMPEEGTEEEIQEF